MDAVVLIVSLVAAGVAIGAAILAGRRARAARVAETSALESADAAARALEELAVRAQQPAIPPRPDGPLFQVTRRGNSTFVLANVGNRTARALAIRDVSEPAGAIGGLYDGQRDLDPGDFLQLHLHRRAPATRTLALTWSTPDDAIASVTLTF